MRAALVKAVTSIFALRLVEFSLAAANYGVAGVVVDSQSQTPLANVRVSLAPTTKRDQKLEQVTKQDGRFSFGVDEAGKYTLRIAKPGYPPQSYRQAGFSGVSSAIAVGDDQDTRQIVFPANRGGVISGQIKDEDSEPVGNALVAIFQAVVQAGERRLIRRGQMRANAAGEFRFANLARGSYYVCAMGRPWFADSLIQLQQLHDPSRRLTLNRRFTPGDQTGRPAVEPPSPDPNVRGTAFMTTFYPSAQTIEEASAVSLGAGSKAQVSITLPLAKAVTVKGSIGLGSETSGGHANLVKKIDGQAMSFLEQGVGKDGTFEFRNVPAGVYEIEAASQSSSGPSSWTIRQDVAVGAADMEVALKPPNMGSLSGRVILSGAAAPLPANAFVSLRDEKGIVARAEVGADGSFSLSRLPPGKYEVTAAFNDYIAAYLTGLGREHLPLTVEIAPGVAGRRDLTMARAASVIQGTVQKGGSSKVGAFVLLMPKDPAQRWAYRVDQTDSDGSYRLATISSGDYFLVALTEGSEIAYRDPKIASILIGIAKPVNVEPNDRLELNLDIVDTATLNLAQLR